MELGAAERNLTLFSVFPLTRLPFYGLLLAARR